MISGKEIHVLDRNAEFYGVPAKQLMENAGKGVADFIIKELKPKAKDILILCGLGNNGGDGLVASRYLSQKLKVTVFIVGKPEKIRTKISKTNYQKLKKN
jgi:NAD(P)H-hydrate epimerase